MVRGRFFPSSIYFGLIMWYNISLIITEAVKPKTSNITTPQRSEVIYLGVYYVYC